MKIFSVEYSDVGFRDNRSAHYRVCFCSSEYLYYRTYCELLKFIKIFKKQLP